MKNFSFSPVLTGNDFLFTFIYLAKHVYLIVTNSLPERARREGYSLVFLFANGIPSVLSNVMILNSKTPAIIPLVLSLKWNKLQSHKYFFNPNGMQIHYLIQKAVKYLTLKENIMVVHGVIYIVDYLTRNGNKTKQNTQKHSQKMD